MSGLSTADFKRLEALHELLEENHLALLEGRVARFLLERLSAIVSRRMPTSNEEDARRRLLMDAQAELMAHAGRIEQELLTEKHNRRYLMRALKATLEEVGL